MNNKLNHVTEEQLLKAIAELEEMAKAERYEEAERYSYDDPYGNDEESEEVPKVRNKRWRRIDIEKPKRKRLIRLNPDVI
jgi:hypothetical protein